MTRSQTNQAAIRLQPHLRDLPDMPEPRSERRVGIALVIAAAVAWSTAPFFTRLLPFDPWTILFWRGLFGGGMIMVFLTVTQGARGVRDLVTMGKGGWLVAVLSATGMMTFIPALQMTDVTNVAVLIATQPFVAAAMAYLWFREAARWQTMLASLVALCGIALIVSNAHAAGDVRGMGLACVMVLAMSAMTVALRRYRKTSMVAAAALSNFLGSLVSLPFAHDIAHLGGTDILVLAMFGS